MPHPFAVVGLTAVLFASLAAPSLRSSATAAQQPVEPAGEFVWHDLVTDDPAASRTFYGALFGWTFEDAEGVDPGYQVIRRDGVPIGGMVPLKKTSESVVAQWLTYVVVADVDRSVKAFRDAGGHVYRGPLTTKNNLRVAVVADPQGAPIGLASRGPRLAATPTRSLVPTPPPLNHWLWREYVAVDATAAVSFYADALGLRSEISEARDNFTYYLLSTDRPRAGLFRTPWPRETSAWLPYVRVADPVAMAARAIQLGGQVALAPAPKVREGTLAIVLDPTGAPLALQKYPYARGATP